MALRLVLENLAVLPEAASTLSAHLPRNGVVLVNGEMGAGKTTLIKALCESLGINAEEVSSPTYSIVNEYHSASGLRVYHFDLYRLETPEEALDFGIEEYFAEEALSFVEWPDRLGFLLPQDAAQLTIVEDLNTRVITLKP